MNRSKENSPDRIRRETVPVKHNGLTYGFLAGIFGAVVWFGGWGALHREQVRRYPAYCTHAIRASVGNLTLFGKSSFGNSRLGNSGRPAGLSADQLRYSLLRYGNLDHRFDAEIIRHGWYPKGASPKAWVFYYGAVEPVYTDAPALVFKWPLSLTLLTFLTALTWGLVSDYRYQSTVIAGIPLDGSILATVDEYNEVVKGDGMKYAVKAWRDR